jgi:hypothetical protein
MTTPADENIMPLTDGWLRGLQPRRNGRPHQPIKLSVAATARAQRDALAQIRPALDRQIDHPDSEPDLAAAARRYLAAVDGTADALESTGPLGAFAVARAVAALAYWAGTMNQFTGFGKLVDAWVATGGVAFANEVVLEVGCPDAISFGPLRRLPDREPVHRNYYEPQSIGFARRLRTHLAAVPDADYAAAVEVLGRYRDGTPTQRILTSYLAPTETAWVAADIAALDDQPEPPRNRHVVRLLLFAATTARQVARVRAEFTGHDVWIGTLEPVEWVTIADGLGADAAGLLADAFDEWRHHVSCSEGMVAALAAVPTDEAFRLLLDRVGELGVPGAVASAARAFPRRALRLLAERADDTAAGLLRGHLANHPDLPTPDGLSEAVRLRIEAARADLAAIPTVSADVLPAVPAARRPTPLPSWADPMLLAPVVLRDTGRHLDPVAVEHLCRLLRHETGRDEIRRIADPGSLAAFARSLYDRWTEAGAPAGEWWAVRASGWFGDDDTARAFADRAAAWWLAAAARGAIAIAVLADLGSDVAVAELFRLSQRAAQPKLRKLAADTLGRVAAARGLTGEQLADRLVPDLGLDPDGGLTLDYGPRQFRVGFDEELRPYVRDPNGRRLPALPKTVQRDDPAFAGAAQARFTALKKEVRTVAADQIRRLEQAMVAGRRWSVPEFVRLYVEHPLVWHVGRRLVWRVEDGPTFRVAEDRTFADVDDKPYQLPDDTTVHLPHPLGLDPADLARWGELFADYELLQPFPQLGRTVHEPAELAGFRDRTVPTGALLGLERSGWSRGAAEDGGVQLSVRRPLTADHTLVVHLEPGIRVGNPALFPPQRITDLPIAGRPARTFADFDPVLVSEIIRDLTGCLPA